MALKLYRVEVNIHATAYIRATSEKDAVDKADEYNGETTEDNFKEITSDLMFDNPDLPVVSLSPAMTLEIADPQVEEVTD